MAEMGRHRSRRDARVRNWIVLYENNYFFPTNIAGHQTERRGSDPSVSSLKMFCLD